MKRVIFGILLMLLLSGCTSRLDGRVVILPKINVNKTQAAVGEEITVTVTGGFANIEEAHSLDYDVLDYRLGACFGRDLSEPNSPVGGLCSDKNLPLPGYIAIAPGRTYQQAFGEQVISSGEERVLEHSFSFTATSPGLVTIFPVSQSFYEATSKPAVENSRGVEIVFR